jgi:dTDP-4-dehydrorhamnose reductase
MKLKVGVIGANGMLGSDLVNFLSEQYRVTSISHESYNDNKGNVFDIIVNANGNSRRFWANQNPQDDFTASTSSVYKSIFDFPSSLYIYISSPDVYLNHYGSGNTKENIITDSTRLSPYGFNKYLSELIVKKFKDKFLIFRSSMILGTDLKKGPFYDIINNKPVFVTLDTKLQLITTSAISDIIQTLLKRKTVNETINVGGIGTFVFKKIHKYFDKNIKFSPDAQKQVYEMNISKLKSFYPALMTSEEYLEEFITDNQHK